MPAFRVWFAQRIIDNDLSVTALSHLLDVYDGVVEDWIAGRAVPSPAECIRLAELFEVPPATVLELAGWNAERGDAR